LAAPKSDRDRKEGGSRKRNAAQWAGAPQVLPSSARARSTRSTTRTSTSYALRLGEGEDSLPPHQRCVPAPPAPGRRRREARPRARHAPVHRREVGGVGNGSDPQVRRRQARAARRGRERRPRLDAAQLPPAAWACLIVATPALVKELEKRGRTASTPRRAVGGRGARDCGAARGG